MTRATRGLRVAWGVCAIAVAAILWIISTDHGRSRPRRPITVKPSYGPPSSYVRLPIPDKISTADLPVGEVVTIRTVDATGGAIAGAQVYSLASGSITRLGETGNDGRMEAAAKALRAAKGLVAVHPFYERTASMMTAVLGKTITLVMRQAVSIQGQVVLAGGSPVGEGITVLAVPAGMSIPDPVPTGIARDPRVCSGQTNASGFFTITGALPGQIYDVHAGGMGLVARTPVFGVEAGTRDLRVSVSRLYGVVLYLLDPGGTPPRSSSVLAGSTSESYSLVDPSGTPVSSHSISAVLAGVTAMLPTQLRLKHARLFLYASDAVDGKSVAFSCQLPGYEPLRTRVRTERVEGSIAVAKIRLHRVAREFAKVTVRFRNTVEPSDAATDPIGALIFTRTSGEAFSLGYYGRASSRTAGIPAGRYVVTFRTTNQLYVGLGSDIPERRLDIYGDSAVVVVDLASLGALRVIVADPTSYAAVVPTGTVELLRHREDEDSLASTYFEASQVALRGIPSGSYWCRVKLDASGDGLTTLGPRAVRIRGGKLATIDTWRK